MVNWPTPCSSTALRGFLGLTRFYRKFIHNCALIATPLTQLLRKDQFTWTVGAQAAFEQLKTLMTEAQSLPPKFLPFFYHQN